MRKNKQSKAKPMHEDDPSFPSLNDEYKWNALKMKRPFSGSFGGSDYHKDKEYDKTSGGFIGTRLREGYEMINDSEDNIDKEEWWTTKKP